MKSQEKIAIPSQAPGGLKSQVSTRFGRCPYFTIVLLENGDIKAIDVINNKATEAMGGAGPMAAQLMANEGVSKIVGANYGPNAANALTQGAIEMYGTHPGTVKDVINAYTNGEIPQLQGSNVQSHTGMAGFGRGGGRGRRGGGRRN
jgi:predicted Fe-Mo cluster-binding NifX family protein